MASNNEGSQPSTPKKTPNRAVTRNIIRWNDAMMAFAFAEFRIAAQKHRVDIKKPMADAAKAVAEFLTGDALIQQLTKRRKRYLEDLAEEDTKAGLQATAAARRATPKKRKTPKKTKTINDEDVAQPSIETPPSVINHMPRSSTRSSREKIKKELEAELPSPVQSEPDSEYTVSPIKAKGKRVRDKKSSVRKKKAPESNDEDEVEYVDETGGINTYIDGEGGEKYPETPSKRMKSERRTSYNGARPTQFEHVYAGHNSTQMVEQTHQYPVTGSDQSVGQAFGGTTSNNMHNFNLDLADYGMPHEDFDRANKIMPDSARSTNAYHDPFSMLGSMSGNLHSNYNGVPMAGHGINNSPNTLSPGARVDSHSPHNGVQSSPSPVRNQNGQRNQKGQRSHTNDSFSSTAALNSIGSSQGHSSFQSAPGNQDYSFGSGNMGRHASPGTDMFTEFGTIPRFDDHELYVDNEDTTTKKLAHDMHDFGFE